jgi:hypothetical protein
MELFWVVPSQRCHRRRLTDDPNLRHTVCFVLQLLRGNLAHLDDNSRRKSDTYPVDASSTDVAHLQGVCACSGGNQQYLRRRDDGVGPDSRGA